MVGFAFSETEEATMEITKLFDFVWPTAVALWNLRWQVHGFLAIVPNASYQDIASRFVVGSDIHGADIRAMTNRMTWDEQKSRFAEFVLTNIFAIYEGWARGIVARTQISDTSDRDLYRIGNSNTSGLSFFMTRVCTVPSSVMQKHFQPHFLSHKKVFRDKINEMLICYKYFKEIRNCQIHNGGVADQKAVDAYNAFVPICSPSSLRTKGVIEHYSVTLGDEIKLSLRGVVGFSDIVLRLMVTIDAQISGSESAERAILERIRVVMKRRVPTLNADKAKVRQLIRGICRNANLPIINDIDDFCNLLLRERIVTL